MARESKALLFSPFPFAFYFDLGPAFAQVLYSNKNTPALHLAEYFCGFLKAKHSNILLKPLERIILACRVISIMKSSIFGLPSVKEQRIL